MITRLRSLRPGRAFVFWALAALTHLGAHDAVWLTQVGPGAGLARALRQAGHGHWELVSAVILLSAAAAAVVVALRLRRLQLRAGSGPVHRSPAPRSYLRRLADTWPRLAVIVLMTFALQENVEHFIAHGHVIGTGALMGPEYPLALPVVLAITGVAAALVAILVTVEHELLARIGWRLTPPARGPRRIVRPLFRLPARRRPALVGSDAGRAPPVLPVTT